MSVLAEDRILDLAHRIFSEAHYQEFVRLLQLHDDVDPEVRRTADKQLLPYIHALHTRFDQGA